MSSGSLHHWSAFVEMQSRKYKIDMKVRLFGWILAGLMLAIGGTATIAESSSSPRRFVCGTSPYNGRTVPATFVRSPGKRDRVMILWVRNDFGGRYTPPERCRIVTQRLEAHQQNRILKYIRSTTVNGYPVLCSVLYKGGSCPSNQVIVTLRRGTDGEQVIKQLTDLDRIISNHPVYFSGCQPITYVNNEAYLDVDILLGETPQESCN